MNFETVKSGDKLDIQNQFKLTFFEEVYPYNALTGRALFKVRDQGTMLFYALKTFDLNCNDSKEIEKELLSLNGKDLGEIAPKCRCFCIKDNQGMLLMDWLEGKTLAQKYIDPPEDFYDLRERVNLLRDLCFAVDKIHSKKIYHRDLKPENILVSSEKDSNATVRLIDFGMSNIRRGGVQQEGSSFRAPEQDGRRDFNLRGQVDIYSIGKIGWWLLTGINPELFPDEDTYVDWDNLEKLTLQERCSIAPKSLETALKTALSYKPENRYRNARDFGMTIKNCNLRENCRA